MAEQPSPIGTSPAERDSKTAQGFQAGPAVQVLGVDDGDSSFNHHLNAEIGPPSTSSDQLQSQVHHDVRHSSSQDQPSTSGHEPINQYSSGSSGLLPSSSGITDPSSLALPNSRISSPMSHQQVGAGNPTLYDDRYSPRPLSRNNSHRQQQQQHIYEAGRSLVEGRVQLFVGNLPFRVRWQDLKDLFRKCGSVLRSDVALTLDNRSKGFGTVLYANEQDAYKAIETFNGYTWQSRVLDVRVDQQDPTGSISLANAAAQQAQQHAFQTHQQAMQNMANMVGIAQAQNAAAAAAIFQQQQQAQGGHPSQHHHQHVNYMFGGNQGQGSSPWMPAAAMTGNFNSASGMSGQGFPPMGPPAGHLAPPGPGGNGQYPYVGRAASPFNGNQLGANMANLSIRRHSSSAEATSRYTSSQAGTRSESVQGGYGSPSTTASSRPGTSPASPVQSVPGFSSKASSPPPQSSGEHRDSISPTSARRPPPGNLGPMPPSIFAGMTQNSQLPHPPAAAAAAVAAGYSIDNESAIDMQRAASPYGSKPINEGGSGSRRGSSSVFDNSARPGPALKQQSQQQQQHQTSQAEEIMRPSPQPQAQNMPMQAPVPVPGGLMNFYSQHRGPQQYIGPYQPAPNIHSGGSPMRNAPSPAYANRHLFVGNIPFNCQWQDLKDLFRAAGQILRADVSLGPDGRSRGFGTVLFATPEDAVNAVQMFNGYEFQGRTLKVHFDKFSVGGTPATLNQQQQQSPFGGFQQSPMYGMTNTYFNTSAGISSSPRGRLGQAVNSNNGQDNFPRDQGGDYAGRDFLQAGGDLDDTVSIPGTPIHELNLAQVAAFPSPGFASPVQRQVSGQPAELRGRGVNADGVAIAPIGSGAPGHGHPGSYTHQQQGQAIPLSPLTIPPMSMMSMPSPGPGGMFSPPLPGMGPMMTPSMPGFSFHPFPQTPPLLPQFLSPGLGPFSPPLAGHTNAFFTSNGPSGLRNVAPGDLDSTPFHSPMSGQHAQQQTNYFPAMSRQNVQPEEVNTAGSHVHANNATIAQSVESEDVSNDDDAQAVTPKQSEHPQLESAQVVEQLPPNAEDTLNVPSTARRASFKDTKTASLLGVPPTNTNRGGSLDIPRPNMQIGEITTDIENGSALVDDDAASPPATETSMASASGSVQHASQTKKSPWNLSWLKK